MTGDFFQLPPVVKGGKVSFAFEADMWNHAIKGNMFKLTKVFRDRKSTRLNSSHSGESRMPSSA